MTAKQKRADWPRAFVHVPLGILAMAFLTPLVWLLVSSLQPREQIGKIPPEWLPRGYQLTLATGERLWVTPPERVGTERLLVAPLAGAKSGIPVLVSPSDFSNGELRLAGPSATSVQERLPAKLIQRVPGYFVSVSESSAANYANQTARRFYVDPHQISSRIRPLFANYEQAILALSTDTHDKSISLGTLLGKSRLPWTSRGDTSRTVTFLSYLANTLTVALLGVLGTVFSSALAAYGLSRIDWPGRKPLFAITLATMMVPFPVLMIPLYSLFRSLGWLGTLAPLWVPACFGGAFNIFLLRQFFATIPRELSEAARLDGASEMAIFFRIILPLAKPVLATVALFHFLYVWNDFLGPLIFLTDPDTFTMALGLQQYQSQSGGSEWQFLMAASVLLVAPVVALFFVTQKTFIRGIATTGIKG